MDNIEPNVARKIKTTTSTNLRRWLVEAEVFSQEDVNKLERSELEHEAAILRSQEKLPQLELKEEYGATEGWSEQLEVLKMQLLATREQREADRELREAEREAEREQRDAERKQREEERKLEQAKLDLLMAQLEEEKAARLMREEAIAIEREQSVKTQRARDESPSRRIKKYGDLIRNVIPTMSELTVELPSFLESFEAICTSYSVPKNLWSNILRPHLTPKAVTILAKLSPAVMTDYQKVKVTLLKEFRLTPKEYRTQFNTMVRKSDESYSQFATRLGILFGYYLRSRDVDCTVESGERDKVVQLMVADRFKAAVPTNVRVYLCDKEGESWFTADKLGSLADSYETAHISDSSSHKANRWQGQRPKLSANSSQGDTNTIRSGQSDSDTIPRRPQSGPCHYCQKGVHSWRACRVRQRDIASGKVTTKDRSFIPVKCVKMEPLQRVDVKSSVSENVDGTPQMCG